MEYYNGKTVFVPGGAGFIGSHLVERLLNLGSVVTIIDNLHTGSTANFSHLADSNRFHFIEHDVTRAIDIKADIIFNLACPASPVHYQNNPIETLRTSVFGVNNLLELAKETGARLVHSSTSEVYGDPLQHPQSETYWGNVNPIGIRSCYDEGKRAAEALAVDFHRIHNVDVRLPRIFNTYGPRMALNDGRVVSNFIVQALAGDDITIYGDGTNTRSFCYVSDMVEALLKIGSTEDIGGQAINVGNPGEFSVLELAETIVKMTASKSKIVFLPLPEDDPSKRKPNIDKATELLGWMPEVNLMEGLTNTIEYFSGEASTINSIG